MVELDGERTMRKDKSDLLPILRADEAHCLGILHQSCTPWMLREGEECKTNWDFGINYKIACEDK